MQTDQWLQAEPMLYFCSISLGYLKKRERKNEADRKCRAPATFCLPVTSRLLLDSASQNRLNFNNLVFFGQTFFLSGNISKCMKLLCFFIAERFCLCTFQEGYLVISCLGQVPANFYFSCQGESFKAEQSTGVLH